MTTEPDPTLDDAPLESAVRPRRGPADATAIRPADPAGVWVGVRRRGHRPSRELCRCLDVRLHRRDPDRGRAGRVWHRLRLVRARGRLTDCREPGPDPGRRHDLGRAGHPVRGRDPDRPGRPRHLRRRLRAHPDVRAGVAGVILYFAATQWWTGGPAAPWTAALASGDRATRLVLMGAGLVLIGWLGNVTIGFWFLRAGVEVITLILLSALVMRAEADPDEPLRSRSPPRSSRSDFRSSPRSSRCSTHRHSSTTVPASSIGSSSCSISPGSSSRSSARASGRRRGRAR